MQHLTLVSSSPVKECTRLGMHSCDAEPDGCWGSDHVMRMQLLSLNTARTGQQDTCRKANADLEHDAVVRSWSHLGVMLLSAICSRDLMSSSPGGGIRSRNSLGTDTTHSGSSRPWGPRHRSAASSTQLGQFLTMKRMHAFLYAVSLVLQRAMMVHIWAGRSRISA